jgi:hypothetical protein
MYLHVSHAWLAMLPELPLLGWDVMMNSDAQLSQIWH